ncbi:hypothetical protein RFI_39469 [Reticulomyxa filosa]|uniref:Uncharacterized protein n=1 Tax=Reticulomyxa filosa TaxID=46433 RepID=X6L954_RETFI|nr:hypothetical protein RFI_39469 [Reticulomyxa filosa]|eukprot:ETN98053.1 hypothetical protein RFI_39469 [Reticulomyxa filosa]
MYYKYNNINGYLKNLARSFLLKTYFLFFLDKLTTKTQAIINIIDELKYYLIKLKIETVRHFFVMFLKKKLLTHIEQRNTKIKKQRKLFYVIGQASKFLQFLLKKTNNNNINQTRPFDIKMITLMSCEDLLYG